MRAIVNHRTKPKNRNKRAKGQVSKLRKKGMLFLEDHDLDTGEELPINLSPQLTNKIFLSKTCINTPNELTDGAPVKLRLPTFMLLFLIPHLSFTTMRLPDYCLCALGISASS